MAVQWSGDITAGTVAVAGPSSTDGSNWYIVAHDNSGTIAYVGNNGSATVTNGTGFPLDSTGAAAPMGFVFRGPNLSEVYVKAKAGSGSVSVRWFRIS